jgi:hypothetical protein
MAEYIEVAFKRSSFINDNEKKILDFEKLLSPRDTI